MGSAFTYVSVVPSACPAAVNMARPMAPRSALPLRLATRVRDAEVAVDAGVCTVAATKKVQFCRLTGALVTVRADRPPVAGGGAGMVAQQVARGHVHPQGTPDGTHGGRR